MPPATRDDPIHPVPRHTRILQVSILFAVAVAVLFVLMLLF